MSDVVQQIKDKLSIEEVVAPYVELHRAGRQLKGRCPFHNEKTPSFVVSPDRGTYHCFGCSVGGDMFSFVQAIEGLDFKGALRVLADKAGVALVREDPQKRSERDAAYAVLEAATAWYHDQLINDQAAVQYLHARGVTDKTIQLWRLGLVSDGWRLVRTELHTRGFTDEQLRGVGLIKGEPGKEPYDVFRHRIMFPMCDPSGRVVAFSGRTLGTDPETPKYVNSPETELYKKSELLFGFDKAKSGIRQYDFSLIVEGQFDVVLAHQAGYHNAVAVSGTALTAHHAALLGRLSHRVVLALDADKAGMAAVQRAAELMLPRGMDVKVARMPEGADPADMIRINPADFKRVIAAAIPAIEHVLERVVSQARDERTRRLQVQAEVLPLVLQLPSHMERDHFEQVIARTLGTTKEAVHQDVVRLSEQKNSRQEEVVADEIVPTVANDAAATEVVPVRRLTELAAFCIAMLEILPHAEAAVARTTLTAISTDTGIDIYTIVDPAGLTGLTFILESQFDTLTDRERREMVVDRLTELRAMVLKDRLRVARAEVISAEAANDTERMSELLVLIQSLQRQITSPLSETPLFTEVQKP